MKKSAVILLGNGFEETEAVTPIDLLRRGGSDVLLAGVDGKQVMSSHNISFNTDITAKEACSLSPDMVIIPGGMGGVNSILNSADAMEVIRSAAGRGAFLCAICAGPTVLAKLGLLNGKTAICYPGMENQLTGAVVPEGKWAVRDGNVITGQAPAASFEFGLLLVNALLGADAEKAVRASTVYHG